MDNPGDRVVRTIGVPFDIADYKGRSDRLRWDDLDFDAFRRQPLDDDTLRVIEYMHDVEMQMTWGAANEWTTQAAYSRLAQCADHPVLTELTRRIARQEGRHIDFYVAEARRRLAASPAAQRVVRWALRRLWRPVGSGIMPEPETDFVIRHLYGGSEAAPFVARIDRRIDGLPGQSGLGLIAGQVDRRRLEVAA